VVWCFSSLPEILFPRYSIDYRYSLEYHFQNKDAKVRSKIGVGTASIFVYLVVVGLWSGVLGFSQATAYLSLPSPTHNI
jgi:hypothetical protein